MRKHLLILALIPIIICQSPVSSTDGGAGAILNCAISVKGLFEEVKNFANMMNSTVSTGDLVYEYTIFAGKLMGALRDCNLNITLKIMPASPESCINDIKNIYVLVQKILAEKSTASYPVILEDIIALIQNVQQAIPDCTGKKVQLTNINLTECAKDSKEMYEDIMALYNNLESGAVDFTLFLNKTTEVLSHLPSSFKDCGLPDISNKFGDITQTISSKTCQNEITASIQFVKNAKTAYSSQNYVEFVHDMSGLLMNAEAMKKDCLNLNLGYFLNRVLNLARSLQAKEISNLQARKSAFSLLKTIDKLPEAVPFLGLQQNIGTAGCLEAVLALLPEAEKVVQEYEAGQYSQIIAELPIVANLLSNLISQCK